MLNKIILLLALTFAMSSESFAADDPFLKDSIFDVSTVLATTAGGAILGLSTLSFVEEPGDHLKNIVVGGAIGLIVGVAYVAYSQANQSKDVYDNNSYGSRSVEEQRDFSTTQRVSWSEAQIRESRQEQAFNLSQVSFLFKF